MRSVKLLPYFLLLLIGLGGCGAPAPVRETPREKNAWIEQTLRSLSLEEKVGQMLMVRAYGYYYSGGSDEYRKALDLVRNRNVGGLVMFQGDVYETPMVLNQLQSAAKIPLLVGSDCEWGVAMRIRRGTRFPEAMALGAARDTMLARRMGEAVGSEMRALGMHQDYAPVVDVNRNPQNPVINTRSIGEDPALVSSIAAAFAAGLQSKGILATAKHFPGHGDTDVDSHLSLPVLTHSRPTLDSIDFAPYRALIKRDVASVMVAHLAVPAIDTRAMTPATLSPALVSGVLEGDLSFRGLVVSDAMEMGALVNGFGADSAAVRAVAAGVDLLLLVPDEDAAIAAIATAVRSGRIPIARIDGAVRKILDAKWTLGLVARRTVPLDSVGAIVGSPEHLALSKEIARRSITLLKDAQVLPLARFQRKRVLNLIVTDAEHYRTEINRTNSPWPNEEAGDYLTAQLRKRLSNVITVRLDPTSDFVDLHNLYVKAAKADLICCSVFSKARSGSGQFGLTPMLAHVIDTLTQFHKPDILVAMGSPYVLSGFEGWNGYVCAYSDCEFSTEAVVEAMCGEIPIGGRLPVTIPGLFHFGDGLQVPQSSLRKDPPEAERFSVDSLARIDTLMKKAIRDSAFPGCQVLVGRNGAVVYNRSFGNFDYSPASAKVNGATMYDIASLTKVIATTNAIMRLYDEKKLRLEDRLVDLIPECRNHGKERITIHNLLVHNAGMPPFKLLYRSCSTPEQALDSVYQTALVYRTGDTTLYSDFDFILLGKIVERITGVALDRYVDSVFFRPLGMTRTLFRPPADLVASIPPTELDTLYRKQLVHGVVHDETAYLLGGVAGHAGLFSTASDLAVIIQMLLNGGSFEGVQYLQPETIRLFTTRAAAGSTRALGWDTKSETGSLAGRLFGPRTFGHTGYTGTSIWVDPDRNLFVIFLTNRVYPTRANNKIQRVRPELHDIVVRSIME